MNTGFKTTKRGGIVFLGAIGLLGLLIAWSAFPNNQGQREEEESLSYQTPVESIQREGERSATEETIETPNEGIGQNDNTLFYDDTALFSYVKKFGPKLTIFRLNSLSGEYGSCHNPAHRTGQFAYQILQDRAFGECTPECQSGCYHGAIEAFFKDHGTANLAANLKLLCGKETNAFMIHQCLHGIGHGLMAWTNYELPDALKGCDLLESGQGSCWTGVFMENIVGELGKVEGHVPKYLSEDPTYPCTIVEEKYKASCWFLQTSRMTQLYGTNFAKVAAGCSQAPVIYQRSCFESMGRDVDGLMTSSTIPQKIAACGNAPEGSMRIGCLVGAVQDSFWDPGGQDRAIQFCTLLTDGKEKTACYDMIISRARDVLTSQTARELFCKKVENEFMLTCGARLSSDT